MLILFNKAISVACFAMRCRQFFLLPHFSQSIDADTNVSAAHSLKLQRKIGWDWLCGVAIHAVPWMGRALCLLFCSPLSMSPCSAGAARDTSPSLGVGGVPVGTPSRALGAGSTAGSFPGESTGFLCKPGASLLPSHAHVVTANSVLNEGFGINAPNLGPSLQCPAFLVTLSLVQCDLGRLSSSYLYFDLLNLHWQPWKSCLEVLNFYLGGFFRSSLKDSVAGGCHGVFKRNFCHLNLNLGRRRRGIGLNLF